MSWIKILNCLRSNVNGCFLLLAITSLFGTQVNACSCEYMPTTFTQNLGSGTIVFSAVVLEHIDLPERPEGSRDWYTYHSLTKMSLTKLYSGDIKTDIIYYANGHGSACGTSIKGAAIGKELLVKVSSLDITKAYYFNDKAPKNVSDVIEKYKDEHLVSGGACSYSFLDIQDGKIVGSISRNRGSYRYRVKKLVESINDDWSIDVKRKYQKMSSDKFARVVKRKSKRVDRKINRFYKRKTKEANQ